MDTQKQINEQLIYTIMDGKEEKVKILLEVGADINAKDENGLAPIHVFSECCYEMIERLIQYGADVNIKDRIGKTPLHHAVDYACTGGIIELLIKNGADINIKDKDGHTPLYYAQEYNNEKSIKLLKEHGAVE